MMSSRQQKSWILMHSLWLIILVACIQVDAQFFTKSQSKSIPRMGRRSEESAASLEQYQRSLIDILLDEYGPDLVENLKAKSELLRPQTGELYYKNDQPIDWTLASPMVKIRSSDYEPSTSVQVALGSRDERSLRPAHSDASLALRALNANRYIQYLAAGGQPLLSYDTLMSGGRDRMSLEGKKEAGSRHQVKNPVTEDK